MARSVPVAPLNAIVLPSGEYDGSASLLVGVDPVVTWARPRPSGWIVQIRPLSEKASRDPSGDQAGLPPLMASVTFCTSVPSAFAVKRYDVVPATGGPHAACPSGSDWPWFVYPW